MKVDILVLMSPIHQERVLDIPSCLPQPLGVALHLAILNTKLYIDFIHSSNMEENCIFNENQINIYYF